MSNYYQSTKNYKNMDTFFKNEDERALGRTVLVLVGVALALFLAMNFINGIKTFSNIGLNPHDTSTLDVTGTGTAFAIPDVATAGFVIEEKGKSVHDAQIVVNKKMADVVAFLKSSGIADKDIKTVNYSANPEYSYPTPCSGTNPCPANDGKPKFLDYDINQSVLVKIRDTNSVGKIVDGIGALGVTSISGPDFTVDDDTSVQAEARKSAIADAKTKADILAKDLGVSIVRVVRFSEGNGMMPTPMYAKADMAYGTGGASPETAQVPGGQNKYTSNVTITYEIR
jgi:uncharacterized protein YggE